MSGPKRGRYCLTARLLRGCHGLAPWCLTFVATGGETKRNVLFVSPFCSNEPNEPRGKPVGLGCHGLAPWSLTFVAICSNGPNDPRGKPVGLGCHGLAPWCLTFVAICSNEPNHPRGKPVGLGCHGLAPWCLTFVATEEEKEEVFSLSASVATSLTNHGASPWDSGGFATH